MIWTYTIMSNGEETSWTHRSRAPFSWMIAGDSVKLLMTTDEEKTKAQRYAHCYGKKTGKKFKTKVVGRNCNLVHLLVERVA